MTGIVVVGGGPAGAAAVGALRAGGYDGMVTLVSAEHHLPYERPELSKEYLLDPSRQSATPVREAGWYEEQGIDVLLGERITEICAADRTLVAASGDTLPYDQLILAPGARARRAPGLTGDRVHYLRELTDAHRLRESLLAARHPIVLGGGFIGSEVAGVLAALGKRVTLVERRHSLMERVLGPIVGGVLTDVHRANGADVRTGRVIVTTETTRDSVVIRTDRETIEGDLLIVGGGAAPNVELARAAGIAVQDGIVADETARTNVPGIFAAGDAVTIRHDVYGRHLRAEHRDWAFEMGRIAGVNAAGVREAFAEVPWYWSDQYEHSIQMAGDIDPAQPTVLRGSMDDLSFTLFAVSDGRVRGAISMNRPRDILAVRKLVFVDHRVTDDELREPHFDLRRVLRTAAAI